MRLHRLEITAFGPFADTVAVDFDALSEAGLFLLSGATGSGKTSVLDAVCFSLYGDVPGDRGSAKRLRSDQAEPSVRPVVQLEATLSGRRFRIVRSPSWARPKKRGSGTTVEQAAVTVSERVEGDWVPLTSRLDEAGHLVSGLVGMNLSQFTQVAMLPQGRFQAFLRARSEDRQKLLQQLFRTGRFAQVEQWLRERRSTLRKDSDEAHQVMADAVSRVSEASVAPLPADWDIHDLSLPARAGELGDWIGRLRGDASRANVAAVETLAAAAVAEASARQLLETARVAHERRARYQAARAELATLSAVDHEAALLTLDAARRAATVAPLRRVADDARARRDAALARARDAIAEVGVDAARLPEVVRRRTEAAARVKALLPRGKRAAELDAEGELLVAERDAREVELGVVVMRLRESPAAVAELRSELAEASAAVAGREALRLRLTAADERVRAFRESVATVAARETAYAEWQAARAAAQDLRDRYQSIREARLDSMAAELAGALAVGQSCPVCGSADHPAKAAAAPGDATDGDEKAALKAVDDAKAAEFAREVKVRELDGSLVRLRELVGTATGEELGAVRAELAAEEARLVTLATRAELLTRQVEEAERTTRSDAETAQRLTVRIAELSQTIAAGVAERDRVLAEIGAELAGTPHETLEELLANHDRALTAGREALEATAALDAAEDACAESGQAVDLAAREAGFADVDEATEAFLDRADLQLLADETTARERRLASLNDLLGEPDAADETPLPPLATSQSGHEQALARLGEARSLADGASARVARLSELAGSLDAAVSQWRPLRDEVDLTDRLAAFVEGRSTDNRLQMRLSAYVLAYRLTQVVAAANTRLARMSDRRYSLEHTGRKGAGETRGGLSLLVRDDWSGESRDPATLSGGETFVVSLALALGLADVITHEAGGADLDTLFVDEGFGSLDADTLDDVMDTLDSLRDGGRVVGVVSHVAEMRDRIPTRLTVSKSRRGSTVAVSR
jgi:exonuclease SbcC